MRRQRKATPRRQKIADEKYENTDCDMYRDFRDLLARNNTAPVEYFPPENDEIVSSYADGVQLILREKDWLPLGSCPVRFEGDDGWIETGQEDCKVIKK